MISMKNKIKESWDKIDMDDESKRVILSNVLEKNEKPTAFPLKPVFAISMLIIICISSFIYYQTSNSMYFSTITSEKNNDKKIESSGYSQVEEKSLVEENLPIELEKYLLSIPQFVQENSYYNGPACVQMVLGFHGIELSQEQLAQELNTSSITGTEYEDIQRVVNKYVFGKENISENEFGYHLQLGTETNLLEERIMADMESKDPVFIALDGNTLYEGASQGNHLVIIVGFAKYKNTDTVAYYYFIDPWELQRDETFGGLKSVTPEDLKKSLINNSEPAYIW